MSSRRAVRWSPLPLLAAFGLLCGTRTAAAQTAARAPEWRAEREVVYQIFVRSFRDGNGDRIGDLRGIREELGYLRGLGVTTLLLTPINPSPTYHNYFASDCAGVDSAYGDTTSLRRLVESVHARGMRIWLDEECQYAVGDNPWWKESQGKPGSRYSGFILYDGPNNTEPEPIIYNLTTLPTYDSARIPVATVNLRDPGVLAYSESLFVSLAAPRGRSLTDGVDGFRLDHMMDDLDYKGKLKNLFADFWAPIFARVRAARPRVTFLAEQADWGAGDDWLGRGGADLVYAFPLQRAIASFDRDSIAAAITAMVRTTPPGKGRLVFIESHDLTRFASAVGGDARKERVGAALDLLLKGTPMIYYGQEIGMMGRQSHAWGTDANDIPDREAMRWTRRLEDPGSAIWYKGTGPWWTERFNRDSDGVSVAEEQRDSSSLLSFYRRLVALRRSRAELASGDERVIATGEPGVLLVLRSTASRASLLAVNLRDAAATVRLSADSVPASLARGRLRDLLSGAPVVSTRGGLELDLPPLGVQLVGGP